MKNVINALIIIIATITIASCASENNSTQSIKSEETQNYANKIAQLIIDPNRKTNDIKAINYQNTSDYLTNVLKNGYKNNSNDNEYSAIIDQTAKCIYNGYSGYVFNYDSIQSSIANNIVNDLSQSQTKELYDTLLTDNGKLFLRYIQNVTVNSMKESQFNYAEGKISLVINMKGDMTDEELESINELTNIPVMKLYAKKLSNMLISTINSRNKAAIETYINAKYIQQCHSEALKSPDIRG